MRRKDDAMGDLTRVVTVAMIGVLLLASEAASQPPTIREPPLVIEGRILWMPGQSMNLAPADNSLPIMIDLRRLPQGHYQGLRTGEYVRIVGAILRPSNRIQAFEIYLVSPWWPVEPP
jgi:hypothetical protein